MFEASKLSSFFCLNDFKLFSVLLYMYIYYYLDVSFHLSFQKIQYQANQRYFFLVKFPSWAWNKFLGNVLLPIVFVSLKLIFKPELISAKESNVCSIPSIMTRTHLLSEMYHQHIGISYTLYHQLSLLFRIIIPKMPIQHYWCWINIKQNPRWMLLYAMFLDEEDELIKLLWYNKWSYFVLQPTCNTLL